MAGPRAFKEPALNTAVTRSTILAQNAPVTIWRPGLPRPAWRAYSAPQTLYQNLMGGPRGRRRIEREGDKMGRRKGTRGDGKEGRKRRREKEGKFR